MQNAGPMRASEIGRGVIARARSQRYSGVDCKDRSRSGAIPDVSSSSKTAPGWVFTLPTKMPISSSWMLIAERYWSSILRGMPSATFLRAASRLSKFRHGIRIQDVHQSNRPFWIKRTPRKLKLNCHLLACLRDRRRIAFSCYCFADALRRVKRKLPPHP